MSRQSSKEKRSKGPPPGPDIYVALLMVGLAAMGFGCALLAAELGNYNWALPT
jgi:hypothetical protein